MQDSVADIVKNLKQAPLLVHVYSENERVKLKTEKACLDEWKNQEPKSPDGLIFVKELDQENVVNCEEGVDRAWGVIVQGKGVDCGPACYMLKTNCVFAGMGLGFCTHFCLMRVKNFRDSAFEQFKDSWLLQ
ncbi:hypothetical protein ACJIZ3_022412 [Penstemon smallii]|uniref:DUF7804 domain-containing protein n=1 Tax=Penstemon smallii TaxID=265156 RepID=A0ABD3TMI4_9LAMI